MEWRISLVQRTYYLEKIFRPLLLIRWRRRQPLLKQPPLPSVTKIIKGKIHLPVTGRMVMVIARFFEGALPTNTGTGRARISSCMAQSQRKREPFIRTIKHQGVRSRHAPYSTNLAYLPIRTNKHPNTGSNNANPQWSFQPWTGHKSHQLVYNVPSGWSFNTFCVKLEEDHTGSMDSSDSARSQTRVYQSSTQPTNSAACAGGRQSTSLIKGGGKTSTKEAICPVQAGDIGFMSPIFVVPKSDGLW